MTTLQLAQAMCGNLTVSTATELPMPEAERLRRAINSGLAEFTALLPLERQVSPRGFLVEQPRTLNLDVTEGSGVMAVNGTPFPLGSYAAVAGIVGHSVTVGADPKLNQVRSATTLTAPYFGSTGTMAATVYGDAIQAGVNDELVSGQPVFTPEAGGSGVTLIHAPPNPAGEFWQPWAIEHGQPVYWWTESHRGVESVSEPLWFLRLWPLPSARGSIQVNVRSFPAAVTLADLNTARSLPVTAREEAWLVAICSRYRGIL